MLQGVDYHLDATTRQLPLPGTPLHSQPQGDSSLGLRGAVCLEVLFHPEAVHSAYCDGPEDQSIHKSRRNRQIRSSPTTPGQGANFSPHECCMSVGWLIFGENIVLQREFSGNLLLIMFGGASGATRNGNRGQPKKTRKDAADFSIRAPFPVVHLLRPLDLQKETLPEARDGLGFPHSETMSNVFGRVPRQVKNYIYLC